jgi:hypothetical protein
MRHKILAASCIALAVAFSSPAHALDSCTAPCPKPPKASRSVSAITVPRPAAPAVLLTATLQKAKKKRILQVEAVMTTSVYSPAIPSTLQLFVDANGIPLEPNLPGTGTIVDCGGGAGAPLGPPSFSCTVTGTWWLDIDHPANAALLTSPPPLLVVTLSGGEMFPGAVGAPVDISMTVRLVKK